MTRTCAANAASLTTPDLRLANVPELHGNRLRLIVERKVFGIRPERGASWLFLSPTTDRTDHEAWVTLPLEQAEALSAACAAFNKIMDEHERAAIAPPAPGIPATAAPRAQAIATAATQVAVLAAFLPAVAARCLGLF